MAGDFKKKLAVCLLLGVYALTVDAFAEAPDTLDPSLFVETQKSPEVPQAPLVAPSGFAPRTFGSLMGSGVAPRALAERLDSAAPTVLPGSGLGENASRGGATVMFGKSRQGTLDSMARNNAAAFASAAQAAREAEREFVDADRILGQLEGREPQSFDDRLKELSERRAPFSFQDYLDMRDFVAANEEVMERLPLKDRQFRDNLYRAYGIYGTRDGDVAAADAARRYLGVPTVRFAKVPASKKGRGWGGRTP